MAQLSTRSAINLGAVRCALSLAQAALAQSADIATAAAPKVARASDADILVTARCREETLRDVPFAIISISGAQLTASGIKDIVAIAQAYRT